MIIRIRTSRITVERAVRHVIDSTLRIEEVRQPRDAVAPPRPRPLMKRTNVLSIT